MNINPVKLEIKLDDGWHLSGDQLPGDLSLEYSDGVLCLTGGETPVLELKVSFDCRIPGTALVLGDAWERGYGELEWKRPAESGVLPWYFLAHFEGKTQCFGVKTQPNAMCYWKVENGTVCLYADVTSGARGVRLAGRTLTVAEVVAEEYTNDSLDAATDFCGKLCDNPRLPAAPVYGGNDWYCCYGENSHDSILEHARKVAECAEGLENPPFMVIDDGWQICHHNGTDGTQHYNGGPWCCSNSRFGDMKQMAADIAALGVKPGIWMRPLYTTEDFPPKEMLKIQGTMYTLDPSLPWVLEKVKTDIARLRDWGYKLIKHDFSSFDLFDKWGMNSDTYLGMKANFSIDTKTTAEIIKGLYAAIREAAGEDVLIIGCNTFSHLSAGFFEIQRTGDDTSGLEWARTRKMGINTLAFRMCQHNKFYAADADCVGVTKHVAWEKNSQWLDVVAKSGSVLFVSIADDGSYTEEVKQAIKEAYRKASEVHAPSRPVVWMETATPKTWTSEFGTDTYNWD